MKQRKTISDRLTNKYQLVIRNEENLAEKSTFAFTYAKLLVLSVSVFIVIFAGSLFLSKTLLAKWFDPRHEQLQANKQLYELALKVDSLSDDLERKNKFIQNIQRIFRGDTTSGYIDPAHAFESADAPLGVNGNVKLAASDSQFRKEFEQAESSVAITNGKYRDLQSTFFFSPITGFISDKYDLKKGHYGIDIVAKTNETVQSVADGTVIMASWTTDAGWVIAVQHRESLVSLYKHNAGLLKKVGNFVNAGDIISIVGNSGEMTDGPHLHFSCGTMATLLILKSLLHFNV